MIRMWFSSPGSTGKSPFAALRTLPASARHKPRAGDDLPKRYCTPSRAESEGVRQAWSPPGCRWRPFRRSARFQPQCRRQDLGANHRLRVGARLILTQIFAADPSNRIGDRLPGPPNPEPAAGKLQCGGIRPSRGPCTHAPSPRTERTKTSSSATTTQMTTALSGSSGPDRDFPEIAQLTQGVRIELGHWILLYAAVVLRSREP